MEDGWCVMLKYEGVPVTHGINPGQWKFCLQAVRSHPAVHLLLSRCPYCSLFSIYNCIHSIELIPHYVFTILLPEVRPVGPLEHLNLVLMCERS